jgi:hypothetical protein
MKNKWKIVLAIGVLVLATLACEFSASTANIKDAYLATDESGNTKTTEYTQDQPFIFIVTQANAPDDTRVKAVWYSVDEAGKATQFVEKEMVTGRALSFFRPPTMASGLLECKVELYLNDKLVRTVEFSVK